MAKKHMVSLDEQQRDRLRQMIAAGRSTARELAHARVLLKADAGDADQEIAEAVEVSVRTVERVRRLFAVGGGADAALARRPQPARPAKRALDGDAEAHLVALACSAPPEGRGGWTMQLLADRMVQLRHAAALSDETVRRTLKKTRSSPG